MNRFPEPFDLGFIIPPTSVACWSTNIREQAHLATSGFDELHRQPFISGDTPVDAVLFCKGPYQLNTKKFGVTASGPPVLTPISDPNPSEESSDALTPES